MTRFKRYRKFDSTPTAISRSNSLGTPQSDGSLCSVTPEPSKALTVRGSSSIVEGRSLRSDINVCQALEGLLDSSQRLSVPVAQNENRLSWRVSRELILYRGNNSAQWVMTQKDIPSGRVSKNKTFGCIREEGGGILMTGSSGFTNTEFENPFFLDSDFWTQGVLEVCNMIGFSLVNGGFQDHGRYGRSYCCHVERQLIVWYLWYHFVDKTTGRIDGEKLKKVQQGRLQLKPIIALDKGWD
jgi:hypothetical protein